MNRISLLVLVAVLAACSLLSVPTASAQALAGLNLVATAGKQRMLSQRVLKAYAQSALGVMPEKAGAALAGSLAELRSGNATLRSAAKDGNVATLDAQKALIDKLAAATATAPNPAALQQVVALSDELLANAETATQTFAKSGLEAPAAVVNLAARQRMLSQRAAGSYLAYEAGVKSPELKARAAKAVADFKAAISGFEDAKAEFPKIADQIEMARVQMIFFDNALSASQPTKEQLTTVATTSERVLQEMDSMTAEIVKQLAARSAPSATAKK
jgi:hypothetical protein